LNAPVPPPRKRVIPRRILPVGSKPDATRREAELCNEIQCLTSKLLELESGRLAEQKDLWHNLEKMEAAKLRAEKNMEALHGQVAKTNKDTMARLEAMGELKKENQRLQKQLDREIKTRENKNREALELERQLKAKVEELTQKLSQIEKPSNHVEGVERKNKELHQLLCSAQSNLDDIKKERDVMLKDLLNATGRDPSAVSCSDWSKLTYTLFRPLTFFLFQWILFLD
jgi:chromosome segregation ATPase